MINCVLVSAEEGLQRQVKGLSAAFDHSMAVTLELPTSADRLSREKVGHILAADPHIAILDLGDSTTGVRVVQALSHEAPDVSLLVVGPALAADELLEVIRAGASEYLPRPFEAEELSQAVQRIRRRAKNILPETKIERGDVTTVFSPKGGVGVTTIAVNLAVALHEETDKDVLLLDLASSLGTAALSMGLQPRYSYLDVIQNFHRMDDELLESFLEVHETGVRVLASPPKTQDQNGPSMDEVMALLRFCRRHFGHVVVDAGHSLTSAVDTAFMDSTHRIVVATPELPTLRNIHKALDTLSSAEDRSPPRLVLNQYSEGLGITLKDVEEGLGFSLDSVIARDADLISESINLGRPALLAGRSNFRQSITTLARDIAGPEQVSVEKAGFFRSLIRPFRSAAAL